MAVTVRHPILPDVKPLSPSCSSGPFDFLASSVEGEGGSLPGLWYSRDVLEQSSWTPWAPGPLGKLLPSLLAWLLWEHVSWGSQKVTAQEAGHT